MAVANKAPRLEEGAQAQEEREEALPAAGKRKTPFKREQELEGTLRTAKVKMLPTADQVKELKRCFSVARKAYNWANDRVRRGGPKNIIKLRTDWRALVKENPIEWATGPSTVASSIQEGAIRQLVAAYQSNAAKKKKNPNHLYDVKFRSLRKTLTETIAIDKDSPKKKTSTLLRFEALAAQEGAKRKECLAFFGNNLTGVGGVKMRDSARIIDRIVAEGRRLTESGKIRWDKRSCSFHFIFTYVQDKLEDPDPTFAEKRIISTDPGVRVFQTWYSPTSGEYGELMEDDGLEIERRCVAMDALQSRIDRRSRALTNGAYPYGRKGRQRYQTKRRLKRRLANQRRQLYGWMESAHYDAANFLLRKADIIIVPKLGVSELVPRSHRVIASQTARNMLTWSHYRFRQRLKSACCRYEGRYIIESTEPGTSKTCGNCGWWNAGLGTSKIFRCLKCHICVDRDVAGARNNFFSEYGRALGVGWDHNSA